jgi:hypothetical protein
MEREEECNVSMQVRKALKPAAAQSVVSESPGAMATSSYSDTVVEMSSWVQGQPA